MRDKERLRYLAAESVEGAKLKAWTDLEGDAPLGAEVALLRYQISCSVAAGATGLTRDLCSCLAQTLKLQLSMKVVEGSLYSAESVQRIGAQFSAIIAEELKSRLPAGEFEDCMDAIRERYQACKDNETKRARGEVIPTTTKRLRPPRQPADQLPPADD